MIFVILGTQDKTFERLLVEIDRQIEKGNIKEKVIVQAGSTQYKSKNMKIFDLISMKKFSKYIEESDYIITHGGVGSILDAINHNKKIIAIPRLQKYGEHENDHQIQIIEKFKNEKYILGCNGVEDLEKQIKKINSFKPKKYVGDNSKMVNIIDNYIEKNTISKRFEILSYLIFSILIATVNICGYYLFNKLGINYLISNIFSWCITILLTYYVNKEYIFKNIDKKNYNLKFLITYFFIIIIELLLLFLLIKKALINLILSKVISSIIIIILSYIVNKKVMCYTNKVDRR